jgi:hypothetical protein
VAVQPELLKELLPAARDMAGALPLLALTLTQLFAQRDPAEGPDARRLSRDGRAAEDRRDRRGRIDQAIDDDPALADACERLFAELATVIDELPTRRTAAVEPLRADAR